MTRIVSNLLTRRQVIVGGGVAASLALWSRGLRAAEAKRIVSVGGAITEIVFALGHGDDVVAVDTTSYYPFERVQNLAKVGYMRALATEGILSMKPDLILADHEAGPPNVLEQLKSMGAPLHQFDQKSTADSVAAKINFVGAALGADAAAAEIATAYVADLAQIRALVTALTARPSVLFLMNAGSNGLRGAGRGTGADEMIQLAGGRNAFGAADGYQSVSAEMALASNPDYVVMMQQTIDEMGGIENVRAVPAITNLTAVREKRVFGMYGSYLLGFGPRTAHAARDFAAALHPQASVADLPSRPWTTT